jgi:hypothetical protein
MKGQFFLIGALLICLLLFFGLPPEISMESTAAEDMNFFSGNMQKEIPHALNLGLNGSDPLGTLYNFTGFSMSRATDLRMNMTCYWVVFMQQGSDVNVTAGNFMGSPRTFGIEVDGNRKYLQVAHDEVNSTTFAVSGYTFKVIINSGEDSKEATLLTNKTSVYSVISLDRRGSTVRKEILA